MGKVNKHACVIVSYILEACLVIDPRKRPPVNEIIAHLYSVAQQLNEDLNSEPVRKTGAVTISVERWHLVLGITNLIRKIAGFFTF